MRCSTHAYHETEIKRKGKERATAAHSCCGRVMTAKGATAENPSEKGSTGLKWAAEERHWVPLISSVPEAPVTNWSRLPHNFCARLRQRLCRKHCRERDLVRCFGSLIWLVVVIVASCTVSEPGATQFLFKLEVHCWNLVLFMDPTSMAIWRTAPLSSCHFLESMQSIFKSKA